MDSKDIEEIYKSKLINMGLEHYIVKEEDEKRRQAMKAIIIKEYEGGKTTYKVLENVFGGQSVEYSSEDAGACEKYCENYYGEDWGWA